jgi:glycosyltransferase involved in cell wall biosynthesis
MLRDKGYPVSLELIGNIVEKKEILDLISALKLEQDCTIYPPVSYEEIPSFIAACDLPAIPLPDFIGWRVSSPIKLMEYMAMGKSMVLTDIEAHRHVVGDHAFAFFAPSSKPEDISDAVERAYHSRTELDERGKKGREIALDRYTWEHQARNLLAFVNSL